MKTNICAILSTSTGCYTYLHRPHAVLGGQHSISVQTDRVCVCGGGGFEQSALTVKNPLKTRKPFTASHAAGFSHTQKSGY